MKGNYPLRQKIRNENHTTTTAGMAAGFIQTNVIVIPQKHALDFLIFCQRNPKPCPLIAVSEPGETSFDEVADRLDIRTDLPSYDIYRNGEYEKSQKNIIELWQQDFVTFLIGCSFSFEQQLISNGIYLRHIEQGKNVAMFDTSIKLRPRGVLGGNMIVSMRPMVAHDAIKAIQITASMPSVHGAPVHIGHPHQIGIDDILSPDYGDAIEVMENELPVFWACGVTPTVAIKAAQFPLVITHTPGCMLVTDIEDKVLG